MDINNHGLMLGSREYDSSIISNNKMFEMTYDEKCRLIKQTIQTCEFNESIYETDYDDGEYVYIDDSDDWIVPIHNEAEYDPEALDEYYSQDDVYIDYDSDSEEKELKEEIYAKFLDDIDEEQ